MHICSLSLLLRTRGGLHTRIKGEVKPIRALKGDTGKDEDEIINRRDHENGFSLNSEMFFMPIAPHINTGITCNVSMTFSIS